MHSSVCAPVTHQAPDLALGEHGLEVGLLEGVGVALVHHRLGLARLELGHELPAVAVPRHAVVRVLHPDDGHVLGPGLVDERGDVGHHVVPVVPALHDGDLGVDDDQRGVVASGQRGHGGTISPATDTLT